MPGDKAELLIVDDEYNTRMALLRYLGRKFNVTGAENGSEAISQLQNRDFDIVLTDLRMPEADGLSVLDAAMSKANAPKCILLTAYGSINDAVTAMKKGAFDFVTKPVKLPKLEEVIASALAARAVAPAAEPGIVPETAESAASQVKIAPQVVPPSGSDDPMSKVYTKALAVAPTRSTVLLTGESGTGKEVIARFIHDNSKRTGLFVPVHCAALSSTLLESELFGYEKGAFTGAAERRRGRFELADGGTLFLDEIGEIDAATQVKLLRVLENRSFERVGGTETLTCDLRVVAATNRDLRAMVRNGTFREDLFYRLSVVNLELPPLRERTGEIPGLADHFLREFARENNKLLPGFTPEAMERLINKKWGGNIRELRNCIECLAVLAPAGEMIGAADIPEDENIEVSPENIEKPLDLQSSEKELIRRALKECNGNRTAAARALGISRRTLYRKLEEDENK